MANSYIKIFTKRKQGFRSIETLILEKIFSSFVRILSTHRNTLMKLSSTYPNVKKVHNEQ